MQLNGCTFHVETLQDEELMVAGFVEEGREPGLIPDAGAGMPLLQCLIPDHYLQIRYGVPNQYQEAEPLAGCSLGHIEEGCSVPAWRSTCQGIDPKSWAPTDR